MNDVITPFRVDLSEAAIDDLRERLRRTRWPEPATVGGWSQGTPLAWVRELCRYWLEGCDFAAARERLNRFPQFRTAIDGLGICFTHVRSPHPGAVLLVLTHGWPGSVVEFRKVIGPLSDPVAHGGDAADAFHVVWPALPGFRFSGKPAEPGWGLSRIADAWDQLMSRLGYPRYGAQGGDWGARVTIELARRHPSSLTVIHLNMVPAVPAPGTEGDDLTEREGDALGTSPATAARAGLRRDPVDPPADHRLRPGRLPGGTRRVDRREVPGVERQRRRPLKRVHPGGDARQHHAVLAARRRGVLGQDLLGGRREARRGPRHGPGRLLHLPPGVLPSLAPVGGNGLPGPALLERAGQGGATSPPWSSPRHSSARCGPPSTRSASENW